MDPQHPEPRQDWALSVGSLSVQLSAAQYEGAQALAEALDAAVVAAAHRHLRPRFRPRDGEPGAVGQALMGCKVCKKGACCAGFAAAGAAADTSHTSPPLLHSALLPRTPSPPEGVSARCWWRYALMAVQRTTLRGHSHSWSALQRVAGLRKVGGEAGGVCVAR